MSRFLFVSVDAAGFLGSDWPPAVPTSIVSSLAASSGDTEIMVSCRWKNSCTGPMHVKDDIIIYIILYNYIY